MLFKVLVQRKCRVDYTNPLRTQIKTSDAHNNNTENPKQSVVHQKLTILNLKLAAYSLEEFVLSIKSIQMRPSYLRIVSLTNAMRDLTLELKVSKGGYQIALIL